MRWLALVVVARVATALLVPVGRIPAAGRRAVRRTTAVGPHQVPRRDASDRSRFLFSEKTVTRLRAAAPVEKNTEEEEEEEYSLSSGRWAQLSILSLLALISDWVCFATAAVPREFQAATGHDPAQLIDLFLTCNVLSCFVYTDVSRRLGLRRSTVLAASLMAAGCLMRCASSPMGGVPPYANLFVGTALVGAAQPFFQCAPPLLSATWFPATERSLATATALNANQLGIAAAFVVGGATVSGRGPEALGVYLELIAAASLGGLLLSFLFSKDRPPSPPTASAAAKLREEEEQQRDDDAALSFTYPKSLVELLKAPGFLPALAAFVASICVTNIVSAFAGEELERAGCGEASRVAAVGAAFQVAIVLGGIALGALVDKTRAYKPVTLACLISALGLLSILGVAEGYDSSFPPRLVVASILALGAVAGPIQPINAELAVEVTHPFDENAVEATQQLAGNLVSAVLVPAYQAARNFDVQVEPADLHAHHFGYLPEGLHDASRAIVLPEPSLLFGKHLQATDVTGDTILLLSLVLFTFIAFSTSEFPLNRFNFDNNPSTTEDND